MLSNNERDFLLASLEEGTPLFLLFNSILCIILNFSFFLFPLFLLVSFHLFSGVRIDGRGPLDYRTLQIKLGRDEYGEVYSLFFPFLLLSLFFFFLFPFLSPSLGDPFLTSPHRLMFFLGKQEFMPPFSQRLQPPMRIDQQKV